MSEDPPFYGDATLAERERQRLVMTLRQLADCIDAAPVHQLPDILAQLSPPANDLFSRSRLVLGRPFGE
jgi:hypothetical protein